MRTLLVHPVALTTAVALTLVVAGCVPAATPADPAPNLTQPSTEPLFASEEEALAAAEEAYAAYLAMADRISADGGANGQRIRPYVTPELAQRELDAYRSLQEDSRSIVGSSHFETMALIFFDPVEVQIDVCLDISDTAVRNSSGKEVTPVDRNPRLPMRVLLRVLDERLVVDSNELISGESC